MELGPINPMDLSNLERDFRVVPDPHNPPPDVQGCAPSSSQLGQKIQNLFHIFQQLCCVPSSPGKAGVTEQSSPTPEAGHGSPDPSVELLALRDSFPPGKGCLWDLPDFLWLNAPLQCLESHLGG